MASKFEELNDKADQKIQEVIEKFTGNDDKSEDQDEEEQEYYQPRSPDQIVDGGKLVLSQDQVDEAESDRDSHWTVPDLVDTRS